MKVKVSFNGLPKYETWNVDEDNTVGEPCLIISRFSRVINLNFENASEKERFYAGVHLCRAKYLDEDTNFVKNIYLTGYIRPAK